MLTNAARMQGFDYGCVAHPEHMTAMCAGGRGGEREGEGGEGGGGGRTQNLTWRETYTAARRLLLLHILQLVTRCLYCFRLRCCCCCWLLLG